ncbi:MAG: hypothetical protein JXR56_01005, partial [Candidatus Cloacimonetes bacterium]|nr:hypothetical protein [Candidatus Cloacimonadota bacterium]
MYRKIFLLVGLMALVLSLSSTVFPFDYKMEGYPELQGNGINYFNIPRTPIHSYSHPFISNLLETDTEVSVDHDMMMIVLKSKYNSITLYPDIYMTFDSYLDRMFKFTISDKIIKNSIQYIFTEDRQVDSGIIPEITIKIPKEAIPKGMRTLLGDEQGKLNLDGSQRLTVTGTSTKRKTNVVYEGKDNSNFDLEMKQDLDLRLRGKIGEKISVDLKHNSNVDEQLFDPNNIHIEYDGDDDEIVQKIEAGNISLSLSGSKYVSTSISSQGLFGVKGELQVGGLKVQTIFSEEEGQKNKLKYTGNSQQDSTTVYSRDYARRTHYFVEPMKELFSLYTQADADAGNCPQGWVDNAIKTSQSGDWVVLDGNKLPKAGSMKVYLDDGNANNDELTTVPGDQISDSNGVPFVPMYEEQVEGQDYLINYDLGLIMFLKDINRLYTIAVGYTNRVDEVQPANFDATAPDGTLHVKVIRIRNQAYTEDVDSEISKWTYQARNIYKLSLGNIKSDGFSLKVYTRNEDNTLNYFVPDDIDDNGLSNYRDYLRLDSNNDFLVNGDDMTVDLSGGAIYFPFIEPFYPLGDSLIYLNDPENVGFDDFKISMSVKGSISRERINLNQIGVLEGSVSVKVNGTTLTETIDYIVDYDMGEITFLNSKAKDPNAQIEIEYEFRSGFSIERKTMAGLRADMDIGDVGKIGSTFVFKSEKVTDDHPKIGNENYNMFLADIDANVKVKPEFMTKMVDFLPLIKTTTESEISLSGEFAFSYFDIYGNNKTKAKEAYIDDMESILNPYPFGISRQVWNPASEPEANTLPKATLSWFKQQNIRANQVYDPASLTEEEENDELNVMAVRLEPEVPYVRSWGGLMKYVGNEIDFSEMKYIQILLKAENYETTAPTHVTMHIDIGDISENFYTFGEAENPRSKPDTEDGANGGTKDGELEVKEDVGLDGLPDGNPNDDPSDNFDDLEENFEYPYINGTERNGILDTEDMDGNGILNTLNRYFEYTVEDITASIDSEFLENENNGWKLFRIPMNSFTIPTTSAVNPDITKIKYARIWFEVSETTKVNLVEFEMVGNKYTERPIYEVYYPFSDNVESYLPVDPEELIDNDESILVGVSDNQKDYHYTSPRGTYEIVKSTPTLEQSLRLDVNNLQANHLGLVRQRELASANWLSYGKLKYWIYPEQSQEYTYEDSIDVVMRVGADTLNYYEVRYRTEPIRYQDKMLKNSWKEIEVDFS